MNEPLEVITLILIFISGWSLRASIARYRFEKLQKEYKNTLEAIDAAHKTTLLLTTLLLIDAEIRKQGLQLGDTCDNGEPLFPEVETKIDWQEEFNQLEEF